MQRSTAVLRCAGLAGAIALLCAVAPCAAVGQSADDSAAPAGALRQWLPSASYEGGEQYDPRLDLPVRLWRAALPLKDVFDTVLQQTGVEIGFWPPGDQNERVRVNVYLNQSNPPSLRELMAQLAWVTGCAFGFEQDGTSGRPTRYYLQSTSIAASAEARLEADRQAAMAAFRREMESRMPTRAELETALAEYARALRLSQDELIARYKGANDHLLVAMLDPPRRAAAEFLLSLDDEHMERLLAGEAVTMAWGDLTADQQAALAASLQPPGGPWGRGRGRGGAGQAGAPWQPPAQVQIAGLNFGMAMITGMPQPDEQEQEPGGWGRRRGFMMSPPLNLAGDPNLAPEETIALRRALGETVTDEQARSLFQQWAEQRREEGRAMIEARQQEEAERRINDQQPLSAAARSLLSSFVLPIDKDTPYALWQIQEAVASASGMNVVSDCFSQPRHSLSAALALLYPGQDPPMTGLLALRLSSLSPEDVQSLAWGPTRDHRAGWEWHDAGTFLRFRSAARDLWRAAMVPADVLAWIDAKIDRQLSADSGDASSPAPLRVSVTPEELSAVASRLDSLQAQHGWRMEYGDPADPAEVRRQACRAAILRAAGEQSDVLRLLATFSDQQWRQARAAGLRIRDGLTPDQQRSLEGLRLWWGREALPANAVLRLTDERPPRAAIRGWNWGRRGGDQGEQPEYLVLWVDDSARGAFALPRAVSVQFELPAPIGPAIARAPQSP